MTQVLKSNYVQLADHETRLSAAETDIGNNVSNINTNATDIGNNQTAIATNASNISTNTSNISTNASNISTNAAAISANASDISDLQAAQVLDTTIVEIGDWNMDSTANVDIAHGQTYANIRRVSVIIRNDADSFRYSFCNFYDGTVDIGVSWYSSTNVRIFRLTGGAFDSTDFDSTSYNRGWIIIEHI